MIVKFKKKEIKELLESIVDFIKETKRTFRNYVTLLYTILSALIINLIYIVVIPAATKRSAGKIPSFPMKTKIKTALTKNPSADNLGFSNF